MMGGLVRLPGDFCRWLFGVEGTPLPPATDAFADEVDSQAAELREQLAAPAPEPMIAVRSIGGHIHGYATGDREYRDAFDVASIPENVATALLTLAPDQLARLANAGPELCGRWALGQRTGLVGVPPVKRWTPSVISGMKPDGDPAPALLPAGEALPDMRPRRGA
ncbi:hypothetical protein [Mesorhizobium sp. B2-4-17]|uniref:hypothetical protein n=1 Tax=Mesorhizobium sp. B2-4-17 TaxID=2589932 RepID=UPI001125B311|nr:hypothetical protein [Mesorhizobium sp. B2-4-17]TPK78227.1 hypothetical protein FJ548_25175 [Mesorhizobium sp. B2-4-17]